MRVYVTEFFGSERRLDQLSDAELAEILTWEADEWDCAGDITPEAVRQQIAVVREARSLGLLNR
jgi:hypothetical protein